MAPESDARDRRNGRLKGQKKSKRGRQPTPSDDPQLEEIERISGERDGYYAEWKHAQNQIREVRWSLMWRTSKLILFIGRFFRLDEPEWWNERLEEAIEATPPEGKAYERVPNLEALGLAKQRPKIPLSGRSTYLKRVTFERDGYWGEWRHAKNRLEIIRSSELWARWDPYRNFKARIGFLIYLLKTVRRLVIPAILAPIHAIVALQKRIAKFPGILYTGIWSAMASTRARLRDAGRGFERPGSPERPDVDCSFRPRVLIVSPYHLHPPNHGSGVRLINLVRELAPTCDVYLLIFSATGENPEERKALEAICSRVDFHRWLPHLRPDPFGLRPAVAEVFRSDRVAEMIRDIVRAHDIDIVQLEHAELGQYQRAVPKGVPVVLSEIDITFRTHRRRRKLGFHNRFIETQILHTTTSDLLRLFRYEIQNCQRVDQVHTMSETDARYLAGYLTDGQARLRVVPNGANADNFADPNPGAPRDGVLFLGNFDHLPNVDALDFLVTDIWPLLRLKIPEVRLTVVGANPSDRVQRLADRPGVDLVGEVPDPRASYHSHRVMAAPIRAGSGTRLKILESFASGIPVVSTTLGVEGIDAEDGTHIILADRAMDFANAIERLLTDDRLHAAISNAALELVRDRYDWRFVAREMHRGYLDLIPAARRPEILRQRAAKEDALAAHRRPQPHTAPAVSVVIPTFRGGDSLRLCLNALRKQETDLEFEIICVDSGSEAADLQVMHDHGALVVSINHQEFNHGLTRDYGASLAAGEILVYLSQDSVPIRSDWLDRLTEPLRTDPSGRIAAVQGGSREVIDPERRFFWGTSGDRFYFTSESERWIGRYGGIGFSTTNCAIRREIWERYRFGWATILEDKKWQRLIFDAGYEIVDRPHVRIFHSHHYDLRSLVRRCASEGHGWKNLGERYRLREAVSDIFTPHVWRELRYGLQQRAATTVSEVLFVILRPTALWWGNRFSRKVLH